MTITDIRYEGFYIEEDNGERPHEHTDYTINLLIESTNMVDKVKYYMSDGVCFISGNPYAELIDFSGELHYVEIAI